LSRFWQFQHWNLVFSHSWHLDSTVAIRALRHNTASCRIHIVKIDTPRYDQMATNVAATVRRGTTRNSHAPFGKPHVDWHEHKLVYINTFEQADGSKKVLLTS
jgi:hypothetical protein